MFIHMIFMSATTTATPDFTNIYYKCYNINILDLEKFALIVRKGARVDNVLSWRGLTFSCRATTMQPRYRVAVKPSRGAAGCPETEGRRPAPQYAIQFAHEPCELAMSLTRSQRRAFLSMCRMRWPNGATCFAD
jgi:hypothetical protein